jgi:hypothetical protein
MVAFERRSHNSTPVEGLRWVTSEWDGLSDHIDFGDDAGRKVPKGSTSFSQRRTAGRPGK